MSLLKFNNPEVLTRLRSGFNLLACDVYISKWSPGATAFSPWTNFFEAFETLGVNEKGSPTWKDEPIIREVDFEEIIRGYNCSGEIKLTDVSQKLIDFVESELRGQPIALLFVPKDQANGDQALYIENILLTSYDEGKVNDDSASHTLTLNFKRRVKKLSDIYRILTIGQDVWNQYPVYGLMWDSETDTYERLGSLAIYSVDATVPDSAIPIQAKMKTCVQNPVTGDVIYYTDKYNANLKEDGTPSDLSGADGEVMVEIPEHWEHSYVEDDRYYYWWISEAEKAGFTKVPKQYVGKYPAYSDGTKLHSWSGKLLTYMKTRDQLRVLSIANSCHLYDFLAWTTICRLYLIEYASFNSQAKIGRGNVGHSGSDYLSFLGLTGKSNLIGNQSGGVSTDGGAKTDFVSYRGIEDIYGNIRQFVDGVNFINKDIYVCLNSSNYADDTTDNYNLVGIGFGSSYASELIPNTFFPISSGGSSSTKICDTTTYTTGAKVMTTGGRGNEGLSAGMFFVHGAYDSNYGNVDTAGRIIRRG